MTNPRFVIPLVAMACSILATAEPAGAQAQTADTYNDWILDRVFALGPMQRVAEDFLMTMKEYPPSQSPGSFNLEGIQKRIEDSMGGDNRSSPTVR